MNKEIGSLIIIGATLIFLGLTVSVFAQEEEEAEEETKEIIEDDHVEVNDVEKEESEEGEEETFYCIAEDIDCDGDDDINPPPKEMQPLQQDDEDIEENQPTPTPTPIPSTNENQSVEEPTMPIYIVRPLGGHPDQIVYCNEPQNIWFCATHQYNKYVERDN